MQLDHESILLAQESLRFALESANMGTWDIDLEKNTVTCSPTMLKLWNIDPETFNGDRSILQKKVHPEDLESMRARIDHAIQSETIYELEYRIFPAPGLMRWVRSRGRITFDLKTRKAIRFSGVVFDISDRKFKEEELSAAIKAREEFFKSASHELKTPLTSLLLQIQVREWDLKNQYPEAFEKDKIEFELWKYKEQVNRLARIIESMLAMSEMSETTFKLHKECCDLEIFIREIIGAFSKTASDRGMEVLYTGSHIRQNVQWDKEKISQAIQSILLNSLLYGNKKKVFVNLMIKANKAHLSILDSDSDIVHSLNSDELNGSSQNLFLARKIIQSHGGEFNVTSEKGKGSEYVIILPFKFQD